MTQSTRNKKDWSHWHYSLHKHLLIEPNLLPQGACLLLAVSGGQDSMSMLRLLMDLQRLHHWKLHVWHGDHNWHTQSQEIATSLKKWCESHHLPFHINQAEIGEAKTEESARNWRYQMLCEQTEKISKSESKIFCSHVLTGHTGSDRAETLLLNLARGSDLPGLGSLRKSRALKNHCSNKKIKLVRPLLNFSRKDTASICSDFAIPFWPDPSNLDSSYKRNKVRLKVLSVLEEIHPGCSIRIAALAERLAHHQDTQNNLTQIAINSLQDSKGLSRQKLANIPFSTRTTILNYWFRNSNLPSLSSKQLEEISRSIEKGKPPNIRHFSNGWKVKWDRESLEIFQTQ